ncbi:peptide deformylase [Capilliphycus salinus ALCB114379]|uniref:peptide deformylase n=1 Tax=Capilliphycus salinus TaxID=2768948 RepID=UPI0039A4AD35
MTNILQVAQVGNPILGRQAEPITDIGARRIQTLIDDLIATAFKTNGVGIAAPQVSQSDRLFIVASRPNRRYPKAPKMAPTAMINPKIISHSSQQEKGWEGCLSVPGVRGFVPRYQTVEVEYSDRYGELQRQQLSDFVARIFQHEYDHLEGIVFLDRVESDEDLVTEAEYQALYCR